MRIWLLAMLVCGFAFGQGKESAYNAGTRLLDKHDYAGAVQRFDLVIDAKDSKADGALYWKAYALNRLGRREDALAAIAALRKGFPASPWLGDAQALEVEVRQGSGNPASPADESNEELKLLAINGLMSGDPSRAVPLLDGVLKGSGSPKLKDRAMFVLTQSHSPEAQQVLANYAKGGANPDLQLRAIRYIGMGGTAETRQQLADIYRASTDLEVKKEILRSLAVSGGSTAIIDAARSEKNPALRIEAVHDLIITRGVQPDVLVQLYGAESDTAVKREILNALMVRRDAKDLVELARKEPDPALKKAMVERLASMRNSKEAMDYMMELLK